MPDTPQTTEQRLDEIAARAADDPFYVSDCEGSLQVWREKALTHVRRDESGEIDMYSFPSTYKVTDQIIELDLSTWDLGEDATDDQQRQDIADLVEARAALPVLLDMIRRQHAKQTKLLHERDLAIAHDRQPYPTAWAYEQACKALRTHRDRAEAAEAQRLALSTALGLGTGAPWDAIRERAAELAGQGVAADRAAIYRDLADQQTQLAVADDLARRRDVASARRQLVKELRRLAAETQGEVEPGTCGHRSSEGHPCNEPHGHFGYHRNARQGGNEWTSWVGDTPVVHEPEGCGAEPPEGWPGDCWCTLAAGHKGPHRCEPCSNRHDAPGWSDDPDVGPGPAGPTDTESPDAPRREPHPTEADLRHALAVAAKFHGQAATAPAVVAEPGKETL